MKIERKRNKDNLIKIDDENVFGMSDLNKQELDDIREIKEFENIAKVR